MSSVVLDPVASENQSAQGRWMVVMFNNDDNTMDEVVEILMEATRCDVEEAAMEMWEAHTFGKAPVHFGSKEECAKVAEVISSIGIKVEVTLEWHE
jgi:ATP-dependent Clp protease adapter protein ClpS